MKKKTKCITETWYEAEDGQEFRSEFSCEEHERDLAFVKNKHEYFERLEKSGIVLFNGDGDIINFTEEGFIENMIDAVSIYFPDENSSILLAEYINVYVNAGCHYLQPLTLGHEPQFGIYIFEPTVAKEINKDNDSEWIKVEDFERYINKIKNKLCE